MVSDSNSDHPEPSGAPTRRSHRVEFPGGNGYSLAGIVDAPRNPARSKPVVLFSHCFTCNKDLKAIVRISRYLSAHGIAVLRYDMTGLGGSGGHFRETNFATNVTDVLAAARYAASEIGAPTILLGHSLGGAASLAAAAEWPADLPPLSGLATLAAPSDTRHLADLLVRMDRRVESEGRGEVTIGGRRWETTSQLIENLRTFELPPRISRLELPVLLFHSPVDETVGFDHALRIMSWIGKPASLIALHGADHLLIRHPADVEYVGAVLTAWITRFAGP